MKKPIFDKYALAVAKAFHLEIDKLFEKSKRRNLVDARQILYLLCMYVCHIHPYVYTLINSGCPIFCSVTNALS